VGLRADLEDVEKRKFLILLGLELGPLGRPGRSQLLYRLRYPGSFPIIYIHNYFIFLSRDLNMSQSYRLSVPVYSVPLQLHVLIYPGSTI
jgi:hypothetical protein